MIGDSGLLFGPPFRVTDPGMVHWVPRMNPLCMRLTGHVLKELR